MQIILKNSCQNIQTYINRDAIVDELPASPVGAYDAHDVDI